MGIFKSQFIKCNYNKKGCVSLLISRMQPVTEAYFGKTKTLLEAERTLGQIMNKLKVSKLEKVPTRITETALKINQSKENKKLCELFQKEFGFKEMVIHWDGRPTVNGYTSGSGGLIKYTSNDLPKLPLSQGEGKYYDGSHQYLCCINLYAGLIDEGLTPGEMMAVILHEIGHNFQCTPLHNIFLVTDYLWIPVYLCKVATLLKPSLQSLWPNASRWSPNMKGFLDLYDTLVYLIRLFDITESQWYQEHAPEFMKQYFKDLDKYIQENKNKIKQQWIEYIKVYRKRQAEIKKDRDAAAHDLAFGIALTWFGKFLDVTFEPLNFAYDMYSAQSGYTGEVFADSFATAYGYGSETVSLQTKFAKLTTKSHYFNKNNKNNVYNQYVAIMATLTMTCLDCHPMDQTRMKNQINKLRRELDSNEVPASMKASIKSDLDKAEKIYDAYLKMDKNEKHLSVIMNLRNINETYFGGKLEIRDVVNRIMNLGMAEA